MCAAAAASSLLWSWTLLLCGLSLSSGSVDSHPQDHDRPAPLKVRAITLEESTCAGTAILSNLTGLTLNPASSSFFVANNKELVLAENAAKLDGHSFGFLLLNESSQSATEKLEITVLSAEERVLFPASQVELSVSENAQIGQVLAEVTAVLGRRAQPHDIKYDLIGKRAEHFLIKRLSSGNGPGVDLGLVLLKPLDYESVRKIDLTLEARSFLASNAALLGQTRLLIAIKNENDNLPEFESEEYDFEYSPEIRRYASLGQVYARDEDGDDIAFSVVGPSPTCCIIEPQTGHILMVQEIVNGTSFHVKVAEKKDPSRHSPFDAVVNINPKRDPLSGKQPRSKTKTLLLFLAAACCLSLNLL